MGLAPALLPPCGRNYSPGPGSVRAEFVVGEQVVEVAQVGAFQPGAAAAALLQDGRGLFGEMHRQRAAIGRGLAIGVGRLEEEGVRAVPLEGVALQLRQAGALTGVNITRHPVNSDRYFAFSDNQALADLGVPAHTISVAYEYPDYHGAADTWDKIDYTNMAAIDRTVALAVWMIANDPVAPRWNAANPKTAKYVEAARKLQEGRAAGTP